MLRSNLYLVSAWFHVNPVKTFKVICVSLIDPDTEEETKSSLQECDKRNFHPPLPLHSHTYTPLPTHPLTDRLSLLTQLRRKEDKNMELPLGSPIVLHNKYSPAYHYTEFRKRVNDILCNSINTVNHFNS